MPTTTIKETRKTDRCDFSARVVVGVRDKHIAVFIEPAYEATYEGFIDLNAKHCCFLKSLLAIALSRVDFHRNLVGVVAQLVERLVRNEKVRGSTPLGSTIHYVCNQ